MYPLIFRKLQHGRNIELITNTYTRSSQPHLITRTCTTQLSEHRVIVDKLAKQLNINQLSDWYKVRNKVQFLLYIN